MKRVLDFKLLERFTYTHHLASPWAPGLPRLPGSSERSKIFQLCTKPSLETGSRQESRAK